MIEVDTLVEAYLILKEYVNVKDRQAAADHLFSVLQDHDIAEPDLKAFASADKYLERSWEDVMGEPEEDEAIDDETDYDYDKD